jgi:hypothetical protein
MVGKLYEIGSFILKLISISRKDYGSMIMKLINFRFEAWGLARSKIPPSFSQDIFKIHI